MNDRQRRYVFGRDWSVANPPESRATRYIRGLGEPSTNPLLDWANDNLDIPAQVVEEMADARDPVFVRRRPLEINAAMPPVAL